MRNLVILMLVLGLASVASATLQISVDGDPEPIDSEIFLLPSEIAILDIWTDADISPGVGEVYWALVCRTADGTISGGIVVPPYDTEPGIVIYPDPVANGVPGLPQGANGVWGGISLTGVISLIPAGDVIYDDIEFHCEWAPNDVVIELYTTDFGTSELVDAVVIHQIPEPATIALLGLGGLLLRRRK